MLTYAPSWNGIKSRAIVFRKEWENDTSEDAEAKSFWNGFFDVFGISRRRVATFEQQVRKLDNKAGFIDLLCCVAHIRCSLTGVTEFY